MSSNIIPLYFRRILQFSYSRVEKTYLGNIRQADPNRPSRMAGSEVKTILVLFLQACLLGITK